MRVWVENNSVLLSGDPASRGLTPEAACDLGRKLIAAGGELLMKDPVQFVTASTPQGQVLMVLAGDCEAKARHEADVLVVEGKVVKHRIRPFPPSVPTPAMPRAQGKAARLEEQIASTQGSLRIHARALGEMQKVQANAHEALLEIIKAQAFALAALAGAVETE